MRDDAARLLVSGWREYNIYIYVCISVKSSSLLKTIIYIYIYKHDRCCCCFQNSRACSSRFACACAAACKYPTSLIFARSMPNDSGSSTSHREAFSFYILFRDIEPDKRAFVSMEFRIDRELLPRSTCPTSIASTRYSFDHKYQS